MTEKPPLFSCQFRQNLTVTVLTGFNIVSYGVA